MAKAIQKITLSPSRGIPFDKLALSQSNVPRIKAGVSVEELAEDIARRGLLPGLSVRPLLDNHGDETGMIEIPAGGRRFQALSLLVKQKRLARTAPIPCIVRDAGSAILAEDDSLAENMQRVALHPLDQFRAFVSRREKGQGDEEIAAAFFVTPQVVKQRLKLASVAPALLEVYAEDGMTLEQLMAFTVNPDHERQTQIWDLINSSWNKVPYQIRRMLTETSVRASDRRAVFVGVEGYQAAGGTMLHDLFQGDDGDREAAGGGDCHGGLEVDRGLARPALWLQPWAAGSGRGSCADEHWGRCGPCEASRGVSGVGRGILRSRRIPRPPSFSIT